MKYLGVQYTDEGNLLTRDVYRDGFPLGALSSGQFHVADDNIVFGPLSICVYVFHLNNVLLNE